MCLLTARAARAIWLSRGPEEFDHWQRRLAVAGVTIEQIVDWEQGGRSIYFRDPAGNSLELAPPTLWGGG